MALAKRSPPVWPELPPNRLSPVCWRKNRSPQLEDDRITAKRHWEEAAAQLRRLLEQRGARNEQIRLLAEDRHGAVKRFELAQIQCQLSTAVDRWKVLTITQRLLAHVKDDYERNRQPETLCEASKYLARLTGDRYRRVWTRFGENSLLVDDHQNATLPIEVLSHGTREQLFLSLRLALVSLFARRGVSLPMVLDDVLVNFDQERRSRCGRYDRVCRAWDINY